MHSNPPTDPNAPTPWWGSRVQAPPALAPLIDVAANLWWCWTPAAQDLFARIDSNLWSRSNHNPVKVLLHSHERLAALAHDSGFVREVGRVHALFQEYLREPGRASHGGEAGVPAAAGGDQFRAAYFCAEFGLTECFPIYCGGLGLLAGDHIRSAAQLKLPFIAVGLLYANGYFTQSIDRDGVQHELMPSIQPDEQPIRRVLDSQGRWLRVHVELPERRVAVGLWRCDVGAAPLILLDTNLPENSPEDRDITRSLYMGDHHQRIKQELVLGVGGVRALQAMGERATVFHMNEGHAAFLALERIRQERERTGLSFDQVREGLAASHIFTTHTPLPAGIDRFHPDLARTYLSWMLGGLGLDLEGLLALGRERVEAREEFFSMAVLALRTSRWCNGVARLHGHVSRAMWRGVWPRTPVQDIPIGHVTNGINTDFWVGPEMAEVITAACGDRWRTHPDDPAAWSGIERAPDERLWHARRAAKRRLIDFVHSRPTARVQDAADPSSPALDENRFTIGFARRFASYKRATLLLRDPARLVRLLTGEHAVQLLIAGKAHPGDQMGKQAIRQVIEFARRSGVADRLVFVENYDIDVARHLVQGVDLWLNNPIRGLEASGTSGMKAALNGAPNCSILDGWWDEAFEESLGFAIGGRTTTPDSDAAARDSAESMALFELLESMVIPEYYATDGHPTGSPTTGILPRAWIARMRRCIAALAPQFSTHRMVLEYTRNYYLPAHREAARLCKDNFAQAKGLSDQLDRLRAKWPGVHVSEAWSSTAADGASGRVRRASASVSLGDLSPKEVQVQVYVECSPDLNRAVFDPPRAVTLPYEADLGRGVHRYSGDVPVTTDPLDALLPMLVRVIPRDDRLISPIIPGLVASAPLSDSQGQSRG